MILSIRDLSKSFSGVKALDEVTLEVKDREILGLIGPNGSGKTTLFNCITGLYDPDGGAVFFKGKEITNYPPHKIALQGISRTFQIIRVFPRLSVMENMVLALQEFERFGFFANIVRTRAYRKAEKQAEERALALLAKVGLHGFAWKAAGHLSHGQRKILEIAISLMPNPRLLLLDEPMAAINPKTIEDLKQIIKEIHREWELSVVLVEHNIGVVMDLCHRVVVLDSGRKIAEGSPEDIRKDETVIEAYFGK